MASLTASLLNSGVETLPGELKKANNVKNRVLAWLRSGADEGLEEIG